MVLSGSFLEGVPGGLPKGFPGGLPEGLLPDVGRPWGLPEGLLGGIPGKLPGGLPGGLLEGLLGGLPEGVPGSLPEGFPPDVVLVASRWPPGGLLRLIGGLLARSRVAGYQRRVCQITRAARAWLQARAFPNLVKHVHNLLQQRVRKTP